MSFFCSRIASRVGSYIKYHVSLASSSLWQFLRQLWLLWVVLVRLFFFFFKMSLNLSFDNVLMFRLGLWVWRRNTTEVPLPLHHIKDICYHACTIPDDIDLDHWPEVVFARFLHCKVIPSLFSEVYSTNLYSFWALTCHDFIMLQTDSLTCTDQFDKVESVTKNACLCCLTPQKIFLGPILYYMVMWEFSVMFHKMRLWFLLTFLESAFY